MSNYSDFFGVGSSGGGGSVPINSYLPFLVTATGNPVGYDAATGLYTHPDGNIYLRTGNTIVEEGSSSYPNATNVLTFNEIAAQYGFTNGWSTGNTSDIGAVQHPDGVNMVGANDNSFEVATWPKNTVGVNAVNVVISDVRTLLPAFTGVAPRFDAIYPSADFTELWIYMRADIGSGYQRGHFKVSMTTWAVTQAYTQGIVEPTIYGGGYLDGDDKIWLPPAGNTAIIEEWDFGLASPTATGNTITVTITADVDAVGSDGTNLWVFNDSGDWWQIDAAGAYTGKNITGRNYPQLYYDAVGEGYRIIQGPTSRLYREQYTTGDGTARTDTDSAQPLFMRIA